MKKSVIALLIAATLLGLALRVNDMDRRGLGTDEGHSAWLAAEPMTRLPELLRVDSAPPLYYALLHVWQLGFPGDVGLRWLSILFGTAAIPVMFLLGRELLNTRCGVMASFFMAASGFHAGFSQIAKNNTLLLLISQLALLALLLACRRPERKAHWAMLALAVAGLLYTHAVAPFVITTLGVVFLVAGWGRIRELFRPWFLAHAAAGILFLPWAGIALHQVSAVSQGFWAARPPITAPFLTILRFVLMRPPAPGQALAEMGGLLSDLSRHPVLGGFIGLLPRNTWWWVPIMALAASACVVYLHRRRLLLLLAVLAALPLAGIWTVSQVFSSIYIDRVLISSMIPLPLLLAAPFALLPEQGVVPGADRWRLIRISAALSLVLLPMMVFSAWYFGNEKQDTQWKEAAQHLVSHAAEGDGIVFNAHFGEILIERYLGERKDLYGKYGLPSGWYEGDTPTVAKWIKNEEDLAPLFEAARRHPAIWLVRAHTQLHDPEDLALNWCRAHLMETEERRFLGVYLYRFEPAEKTGGDAPAVEEASDG